MPRTRHDVQKTRSLRRVRGIDQNILNSAEALFTAKRRPYLDVIPAKAGMTSR